MGGIYNRSICAVLAVLFLSMSMSGCLSLVLGREIMEGVRGEPEIKDEWTPYDLSHSFVIDESGGNPLDQIEAEKSEDIKIDETVSKIIIVFKTSVNYHVGDSDQRYVHVKLLWCDDSGSNCDTANPIYERMADNGSYSQETFELNREIDQFEDGLWNLTINGLGAGTSTGISTLDFEDSWLLLVRVARPCLEFPESKPECTPLVDL